MPRCRHCGVGYTPSIEGQLACDNCCSEVLSASVSSKPKSRPALKPFPTEEEYHRQSESEVDRGWTLPTQEDLEETWFNQNPADYIS